MSNPQAWDLVQVGDVLNLAVNSTNFIEGVVTSIYNVNQSAGTNSGLTIFGRGFVLDQIIKMGSVPTNGSGCSLTRRTLANRMYIKLGTTLSQTIYSSYGESVRYNMAMYDTGVRRTVSRSIVCTIGYQGAGSVINSSVEFAIMAGR